MCRAVTRSPRATVHGYAMASAWAAGIFVLAAVLAGILIDVHPGQLVVNDVALDAPRGGTRGVVDVPRKLRAPERRLSPVTGAPAGRPA